MDKTVYSIATQGIGRVIDDDNYVESYNIMYQKKGEAEYQYMRDDDGKIIVSFNFVGQLFAKSFFVPEDFSSEVD